MDFATLAIQQELISSLSDLELSGQETAVTRDIK